MALVGPYTDPKTDTFYPDAYARINNLNIRKLIGGVVILIYPDQAAREANEYYYIDVIVRETDASVFDGDTYPLAYAYLKSLPMFEGWVDA